MSPSSTTSSRSSTTTATGTREWCRPASRRPASSTHDLADALRAALAERTGKEVVLTERIDPEVLGGIRVNLGDSVLDGTLRRGLQDMRRSLAASQGRG